VKKDTNKTASPISRDKASVAGVEMRREGQQQMVEHSGIGKIAQCNRLADRIAITPRILTTISTG
jgi:hypothetical protein